jgi:hypothetical protein
MKIRADASATKARRSIEQRGWGTNDDLVFMAKPA